MELFIVILQILSLVINRNRDNIRIKELKRHFIESLIQKTSTDDNNTIRKNLAQKTLSILISSDIIIIGATNGNDDAYGRNDDTRKFDFGDENDADVESDTQGSTY